MSVHPQLKEITERIKNRSIRSREAYLKKIYQNRSLQPTHSSLGCGNLAHTVAVCQNNDKQQFLKSNHKNIGIVTAYNDMLSAHQPFKDFPDLIKKTVSELGGVAMVAGGVPAMCDGVTQSQLGMELSLFSREVIAMSSAIALSHNVFDGIIFLGVCDKIVPGLVMAAATFGHLPAIFLPAGPMPSGLSNDEKTRVRQLYASKKIGRDELLEAEMKSYHSPGTCTFYGTANTNQMIMEVMGLHMPASTFVNPYTPERESHTIEGVKKLFQSMEQSMYSTSDILDVSTFVNAIVALNATGGSTNLLLHLPAMARSAGVILTMQDFADISQMIPLLVKIYPNGHYDINDFHKAGGVSYLMKELLQAGLLHEDVMTVAGKGLFRYAEKAKTPLSKDVLRPISDPFQPSGGIKYVEGNLGEAVVKASSLTIDRYIVEAKAKIFHNQESVKQAYDRGELNEDVAVVVRFQGPKANGMPELHGLTPVLGLMQDRGQKVMLITDGRMSGASGKIPSAIHLSPEALSGGMIAKLRNGDLIRLDIHTGTLNVLTPDVEKREPIVANLEENQLGLGRELFDVFRQEVGNSMQGASIFRKEG